MSDLSVTKALLVIEALCENACRGPSAPEHQEGSKGKCFPCDIYRVAHSVSATCPHPEWQKQTLEIYEAVKNG